MKQIYPSYPSYIETKLFSYPSYIETKLFSYEYDEFSTDGYILRSPLFEDYKYGKEYLLLKDSYFKITNINNLLIMELKRIC